MEQYWMPKKLDFENLRLCLDNYKADRIQVQLVGTQGGTQEINENLEGRTLDFSIDNDRVHYLIDGDEVFRFAMKSHNNEHTLGFSLAYERFEKIGQSERLIRLDSGLDPYDPKLPEPRRSFLMQVIGCHALEIYFHGRIHLKFHSWWQETQWKYWAVAKERPKK